LESIPSIGINSGGHVKNDPGIDSTLGIDRPLMYCNQTIQNRIEEHPDYETIIRDNPIELLTKIKVLMHDPIRAKFSFALLTQAMIRMLNIKQIENEGLLDYVKRFKQSCDIMKSHVGADTLEKFV
jgi:hypothetical protein